MKKYLAVSVLAIGISLYSSEAHAQVNLGSAVSLPAAMTGSALGGLVSGVVQQVQNAGTTLGGEAGIQLNGLAGDLNTQMVQLRSLIGDKIDQPLQSLGANVQSAATQLFNATTKLNDLLTHQQQCLTLNANLFVSGVRNVVQGLKSGVPFVSEGRPNISSFTFQKVSMAMVVPPDGGRFDVSGFHLWVDNPPESVLQTEDRSSVLATLTPERGTSDDDFTTEIPIEIVTANAGKCLDLKVTSVEDDHFLFIKTGETRTELHVPMCISQDYESAWSMTASFNAVNVQDGDLGTKPPQTFYFDNNSCEDRKSVSGRLVWADISADQRITNLDLANGDLVKNQSNVNITVTGNNSVTADGWLDTASCFNTWVSHSLEHSTIFQKAVTPHYSGPRSTPEQADATVGPVNTSMPQTQVCAELPKSAGTATTLWWFKLALLNAKSHPSGSALATVPSFYESPRETAGTTDGTMPTAHIGAYAVDAKFSPTPVNGKVQLCAVVQVPSQCRY